MDCALLQSRTHSGSSSSTSSCKRDRGTWCVPLFNLPVQRGWPVSLAVTSLTCILEIISIRRNDENDELCGYGMEADCGCLLYMMFPVQIKMQGQSFFIGQIMLVVAAALNQIKKDKAQLQWLSLRPWSPMLYVNRCDTKFINFQGWLGLQMIIRCCSLWPQTVTQRP